MRFITDGNPQPVPAGRRATYLVQNEGPADLEVAGVAADLGSGVLLAAGMQTTIDLAEAAWPALVVQAAAGTAVRVNRVGN